MSDPAVVAAASGPRRVAALLDQRNRVLGRELRRLARAFESAEDVEGGNIRVSIQGLTALERIRGFYAELRQSIQGVDGGDPYRRDAVSALERLDEAFEQATQALTSEAVNPVGLARRSARNATRAERELVLVRTRLARRERLRPRYRVRP